MNQRMISVTILGKTREYPYGTSYGEIVEEYKDSTRYPIVLVIKDGKLCELHKKLKRMGFWSLSLQEMKLDIKLIKEALPCFC